MTFAVVIPAAGSGSRAGGPIPKQYVVINGRPVIRWSLELFAGHPDCVEIVVAAAPGCLEEAARVCAGIRTAHLVAGSTDRQGSIRGALEALTSSPELVLVHDAVRPCISRELVDRVTECALSHGAAIPVVAVDQTVKMVDPQGRVLRTIPRADLRLAQTPQAFRRQLLIDAHDYALHHQIAGTDDASIVEAFGETVWCVPGSSANIKITHPEDFLRAEEWLAGA